MATSAGWICADRLVFFSLLYLPVVAYEECYEASNMTSDLRKLQCPGVCCVNSDYEKYCCGENFQSADNDTRIEEATLAEKSVGTIIGGVIVFLAMCGGVIACCFCKPSCVPQQKVGVQRQPGFRHHSVITRNPTYTHRGLHHGHPTPLTPVSYPTHTPQGQQWPV